MLRNSVFSCLAVVCLSGLILTGCKTKGTRGGRSGIGLDPDRMGEYALGERFDEIGERVRGPAVEFGDVLFAYDSYLIARSQIPKIERAAEYMKRNKHACMVVEGNCDERGSREYNMSLGSSRAHSVRSYLIHLGISSDKIQTRSYGEEKPVDYGHNERAWARNRRVEFAVYLTR